MYSRQHSERWVRYAFGLVLIMSQSVWTSAAWAWGDEGHEIIGLIAEHYLEPQAKKKVDALLAGDTTGLTLSTDIGHEATWADHYRDSDRNTTKKRYNQTRQWHFADIEINQGNIDSACFHFPTLTNPNAASAGTPHDCVVDKIEQFASELKSKTTTVEEKRLALQFLLHFVGDEHQPLHSGDDHDKGGNDKRAKASDLALNNLHHDWDTEFVKRLGLDSSIVADSLVHHITLSDWQKWSQGTPRSWAIETNAVANSLAYGKLADPDAYGIFHLSDAYVAEATKATATQLSRAGVRLSVLLNASME
jgi:hypothetical protein